MPAWKHLMGFCAEYVNRSATALRESESTDPVIQSAFVNAWRERSKFLDALRGQVATAINNKAAILEESMTMMGATREQIDELLEAERIVNV